jgi:spectinomycin phosphotransferase
VWLDDFERLAGLVDQAGGEPVVTHGEPHPGDLLNTNDGVLLVDWDTVGLAPPERDLWMLDDGSPNALAPYAEASGRTLDDRAIALFRLTWRLMDIVVFTSLFRSEHESNRDTEKSWRAYTDLLEGSLELRPCGPPPGARA